MFGEGMKNRLNPAKRDILRKQIGLKFFEPRHFKRLEHNFIMTNRLISEKIVSWDFVPPYDFAAQFLANRARRRGEQTSLSTSKNLTNPVLCSIFENARTHFERNAAGVSQNPQPLGRRGKERGTGGKEFPRRPRFRKIPSGLAGKSFF